MSDRPFETNGDAMPSVVKPQPVKPDQQTPPPPPESDTSRPDADK